MSKIKNTPERRGTVQPHYKHKRFEGTEVIPSMRLQGKWLQDVAKPGQRYTVTLFPEIGSIYIKFLEPEAGGNDD